MLFHAFKNFSQKFPRISRAVTSDAAISLAIFAGFAGTVSTLPPEERDIVISNMMDFDSGRHELERYRQSIQDKPRTRYG